MFHIVLFEPEIPPNTGNVIRLAANIGASLHLIRPLGFDLDHAKLRRAGLDYHEFTAVTAHDNFVSFLRTVAPKRVFALTTKATRRFTEVQFQPGDAFVFGPETRGLPAELLATFESRRTGDTADESRRTGDTADESRRTGDTADMSQQKLLIPMTPGGRSLNLSNAVAVVLFEAWRQIGFVGARE